MRRLLDAREQLLEGEAMGAGHAQARDMRGGARRKGRRHLLLHHPVR
jgi:hypothetical protein